MLILAATIAKHELRPLARSLGLDDILEGARKVQKILAQEIKPVQGSTGNHFFKVRIGSRASARMIVFMVTENRKIVPILIRLKNDKLFGMNMAMNNPAVVAQCEKNFSRVREDIKHKRFESFDIKE